MSYCQNSVHLQGRFTQDLELKIAQTTRNNEEVELYVLNNCLAVAVNDNTTKFINVVAWGTTAKFICEHFKKGDEILVDGSLTTSPYKIDGKTINTTVVKIEDIYFTHGRQKKDTEYDDGDIL